MAIVIHDTFTDSDSTVLSAHTPDLGSFEAEWESSGIIMSNALTSTAYGQESATYDPPLTSADYSVRCTGIGTGIDQYGLVAVLGRASIGLGLNGYVAGYISNPHYGWAILEATGNVYTELAYAAFVWDQPESHDIELGMVGDELTLYVDGFIALTATDSTHAAPGRAGVFVFNNAADSFYLDDFIVNDAPLGDPFAHVVTGRGSFPISGYEWISVTVSGRPAHLTSGQAEPPNWYHVGMLSWGTDNGVITAHPITRDAEIIHIPTGMTVIHYEFTGAIEAVITERLAP